MVLEVFLVFVECVVLIDVLHVRRTLNRGVVALGASVAVGRVALRVVDILISAEDAGLHVVVVRATEIVVVVVSRVCPDGVPYCLVDLSLHSLEEVLIRVKGLLFTVVESVETYVLQSAAALAGSEGIGDIRRRWHLSPLRGDETVGAVDRHTALGKLLAVVEHVFRYLAEIDIEVTAVVAGIAGLACVDKGIHHPKLHILDVGCLEVVGVKLTHHAAPVARRIVERTVGGEVWVEVVRTTLVGIVGKVEDGYCRCGSVVSTLVAVGIEFLDVYLTHVGIAELVEVTLDVSRSERRTQSGEERIDGVPGKL